MRGGAGAPDWATPLEEGGPEALLLIPGPTPLAPEVLAALARPPLSHTSPAAAQATRAIQAGVAAALGAAEDTVVHVVPGSGTLALESALVNLVEPGDRVVCCSQGFFGDRFAAIAGRLGAVVTHLQAPWGEAVDPGLVAAALAEGPVRAVTVTHVDTATGVAAPLAGAAQAVRDHDALLVVDAVASAGGMPVEMARLGIDVVASSSQKALAMPAGLALVAVGARARARRAQRAGLFTTYLDWALWDPVMAEPTGYFATPAVNLLVAGAVAVGRAEREGWTARFERHRALALAARAGLGALGLHPAAAPGAELAATLSAVRVPAGVDPQRLREAVQAEGVVIAGGLGPWAADTVRLGHMGEVRLAELLRGLSAVERALASLGARAVDGAGVAALLAAAPPG
ncbi:MAG TPA: aminotransferase class V-fold PLP-dependent enzyme [Candidatus Micrarchaeia archaeon]|nr:aminotransferase class V-fold PLP-dependent enzyme [Candidatus Micrarchaeia archaeon]